MSVNSNKSPEVDSDTVSSDHTSRSQYGSNIGQVMRYFNRKGYGFVVDLHDSETLFIHNTDIIVGNNSIYRKLYPGEYVSYDVVDGEDGRKKCTNLRGVMGKKLLTENNEYNYRYYPKQSSYHDMSELSSYSDLDSEIIINEDVPEKEVINKEAPEGIEIAEFDGLNISEEMG